MEKEEADLKTTFPNIFRGGYSNLINKRGVVCKIFAEQSSLSL
jgi:hypothetical protein